MKLIQTWGKVERPWGYEIRADFDNDGVIINEVMGFDKEPTQDEIDKKVEEIKVRLEAAKPELPMMEMENPEVKSLKEQVSQLQAQVSGLQVELVVAKRVEPIKEVIK